MLPLSIAAALLTGCYNYYTLRYSPKRELRASLSLPQLSSQVGTAIKDFGFREAYRDPLIVSFERDRWATRPDLAGLGGADARTFVTVGGDPPGVTILDVENTSETPFVSALKHAVEGYLTRQYGEHAFQVRRVCDLFM